jgi:hypothetical protein
MPTHWIRGGSSAPRTVACPGSVAIREKYRHLDEGSSPAAIDGTHTHTLLETSLLEKTEPHNYIGKTLKDHEGEFLVDADRAVRARVAYKKVMETMDKLYNQGLEPELYVEKFVDAGIAYGIPGWGGSLDVGIVYGRRNGGPTGLMVIDYKDGRMPVSPESYQLGTYALGAIHTLDVADPDKVHQMIIQPKVSSTPKEVVYTRAELSAYFQPLIDGHRESLKPDAPRRAGDHCSFCVGATVDPDTQQWRCPEYPRSVHLGVQSVSEAFANVPVPPGAAGAPAPGLPLQLPEITPDLSDEKIAELLDIEPLVTAMFKDVREEALRRIQGGQIIPNHKAVHGRASTVFKNAEEAAETLKSLPLKKAVLFKEVLRTPKQIMDSDDYKALGDRRKKKVEDLIDKRPGKLTIVPESDPRPAAITSTKVTFEGIEPPEAASSPTLNLDAEPKPPKAKAIQPPPPFIL